MTWRRIVARTLSECSALRTGVVGCHCGFRILLYHAVGTRLKHDSYGISIDPLLFERHMQILAQLEDAEVVGLRRPEPGSAPLRVAITFDDGYKDNLHVAAPILLKYGMPFTVFATVSYVRSRAPEYLTPEELRELAGFPGATIGSHGVSHLPLADCDEVTVWHELEESRRFLEEAIGRPVQAVAYPHGSTDRRVANVARRAGYLLGVCSRFDINHDRRDPLLLCRTEVVASDSERVFRQKLCGAWDWCRWRAQDPATTEGQSA